MRCGGRAHKRGVAFRRKYNGTGVMIDGVLTRIDEEVIYRAECSKCGQTLRVKEYTPFVENAP